MNILIVEDDVTLSKMIKEHLKKEFKIDQAMDGEEAMYFVRQNIYDAIILDIMLPILNGYQILEKMRAEKIYTPVLLLTARSSIEDKIVGFEKGADDYLVKPFHKDELLIRIEAMIRRNSGQYTKNQLHFKELLLDKKTRKVTLLGEEIELYKKQYDILEYMMQYQNEIITKEQIFDKIWGFSSDTTTNVVEVYTSKLRKKLKEYGYEQYIITIRGGGYMLTDKC